MWRSRKAAVARLITRMPVKMRTPYRGRGSSAPVSFLPAVAEISWPHRKGGPMEDCPERGIWYLSLRLQWAYIRAVPTSAYQSELAQQSRRGRAGGLLDGPRPFQDHDVSPRMVKGRFMKRPAHRRERQADVPAPPDDNHIPVDLIRQTGHRIYLRLIIQACGPTSGTL